MVIMAVKGAKAFIFGLQMMETVISIGILISLVTKMLEAPMLKFLMLMFLMLMFLMLMSKHQMEILVILMLLKRNLFLNLKHHAF